METQDSTDGNQPKATSTKKGGAAPAAAFWARFPTPEARSQYMKERWAKTLADRAKKAASKKSEIAKRSDICESDKEELARKICDADEHQAARAICELRVLLGDVLGMLEAVDASSSEREARGIIEHGATIRCLLSANSMLLRGIAQLTDPWV